MSDGILWLFIGAFVLMGLLPSLIAKCADWIERLFK